MGGFNSVGCDGAGPLGDYAMVFAITESVYWFWLKVDDPEKAPTSQHMRSPFRYAISSVNRVNVSWQPCDTFSWIIDGLSNQFLIGEKHIPVGRLEKCPNITYPGAADVRIRNIGDCSMLQGGGYYNSVSMARALVMNDLNSLGDYLAGDIVVNMICRPNDYADDLNHNGSHSPLRKMAFGSWHPGISQFLLGDGSVRGVSVTTDTPILSAYALVDDGEAVSLP